jgi:hypothetical protein
MCDLQLTPNTPLQLKELTPMHGSDQALLWNSTLQSFHLLYGHT